jgi:tetratricopeptide (TPR) repeat protein
MGGIGKTTLGLVVAHRIKKDYPDAQIFLDLKGTTTPLSALDAMRHVILSFEPGMDVSKLDEANMSAIYQSVLDGKRALLFLDNARFAEQVAPLRSHENCAILVTSRWTFGVPGLKNRRLDVMREENAEKFLLELCPRIGEHAAELAKACAYLPLALRIGGSFLQVNEDWKVEKYITKLNDRKQRLDTLKRSREETELTTEPDLLATFELSYSVLSGEDQKRWRMLSVFPTSFDVNAASALWELDEEATSRLLSLLLRYSLLNYDQTSFRHSVHDLLVDFSLMQMTKDEEVKARTSHSVYYSKVLAGINQMYLSRGRKNTLPAWRLYDAEWKNIETGQLISVLYMEETRDAAQACSMYAGQGSINRLRLKPKDRIQWIEAGLRAARFLNDRESESKHLAHLGDAYMDLGNPHKAIESYGRRLAIARESGNRRAEESTLGNMGIAYQRLGDGEKSRELGEQALAIAREIADRNGESAALGHLGTLYADLGDTAKAIEFYEQALAIAREYDNRGREADILNGLAYIYADSGDRTKAIEFYQQALVIAREIGERWDEAGTLFDIGLVFYDLEDREQAVNLLNQALQIFEEIEFPQAERVRNKLKEWGAL